MVCPITQGDHKYIWSVLLHRATINKAYSSIASSSLDPTTLLFFSLFLFFFLLLLLRRTCLLILHWRMFQASRTQLSQPRQKLDVRRITTTWSGRIQRPAEIEYFSTSSACEKYVSAVSFASADQLFYSPAQRSEARWVFQRRLFVCQFVCPHDNFPTTKRRTIKLGGQVHCTKVSPEFEGQGHQGQKMKKLLSHPH